MVLYVFNVVVTTYSNFFCFFVVALFLFYVFLKWNNM